MADAASRAWRERLVALVGLAFGGIKDVGAFIETGQVSESVKTAPAIDAAVARHMRACEIAGRFVMPDEVEKFLGQTQTTPSNPPHTGGTDATKQGQ